MSEVNELRFWLQEESSVYKFGLNENICNSKQKWNHNECQHECKELRSWISSKDDYMWNTSMWNFECIKVCKIDEYLDIQDWSCKKRLFAKLVAAIEDEILTTT